MSKQKIIDFIEALDFDEMTLDGAFNVIQSTAECAMDDVASKLIHFAVQFLYEDTSWLGAYIYDEDKEKLYAICKHLECATNQS